MDNARQSYSDQGSNAAAQYFAATTDLPYVFAHIASFSVIY